MTAVIALLASSAAEDSEGWGFLLIAGTILAVVIVIAAIWTFAAKRGSRTPERTPQRGDHGVRGH